MSGVTLTQPTPVPRDRRIRRRPGRASGFLLALDLAVMFLRVAIIVTAWIALFLGAFFGYLTAPFIVLAVFVAFYAVIDRYRIRRRKELERRRRILEEAVPDPIYEPKDAT